MKYDTNAVFNIIRNDLIETVQEGVELWADKIDPSGWTEEDIDELLDEVKAAFMNALEDNV